MLYIFIIIWAALLLGIHLAVVVSGTNLIWGADAWSYFGLPEAAALSLIGVVALLPVWQKFWMRPGRKSQSKKLWKAATPQSRTGIFGTALLGVLASVLLFRHFTSATDFLGDGYLLLGELESGVQFKANAPLSYNLILLVHRAAGWFTDISWREAVQWVSYGSGIIFLGSLFLLVRMLGKTLTERSLFFSGIASMGIMQFFFGYVETYPSLAAAVMLLLYLGIRYLITGKGLVLAGTSYLLCSLMHLTAVALGPAIAYLFYLNWRAENEFAAKLKKTSIALLVPMLVVATVMFLSGFDFSRLLNSREGVPLPFIPLVEPNSVMWNFGLFSSWHLLSLFNVLILVSPFLPVLIFLAAKGMREAGSKNIFLGLCTLFPVIAFILFNPEIGYPRDWDIFAYCLIAPTLLGLLVLRDRFQEENRKLFHCMVIILAVSLLHSGPWILLNADTNKSEQRYASLLSLPPKAMSSQSWGSSYEEAAIYYRQHGNPQAAIRHYKMAIKSLPDNPRFWMNLADIYNQNGRPEKAVAALDSTINLFPENKDAHWRRAAILSDIGRNREAIESYSRAWTLDPSDISMLLGRGNQFLISGEYDRAIEDYNSVLENCPENVEVLVNRGVANLRSEYVEEAVADFSRAIEFSPASLDAHFNRGSAYEKLGQHTLAIRDYIKTIQIDPGYAIAYFKIGMLHLLRNETVKALENFNKSIALDDNNASYIYYRGLTHFRNREYKSTITDMDKVISLTPQSGQAYYLRASALLSSGQRNAATRDLHAAKNLGIANAGKLLAELE